MRIVADAQLPFAADLLGNMGEVETVPAGVMTAASLRGADAVIVRSVTRVDAGLLGGTGVRFVGSATSGTDHVDLGYLRAAGIGFADARGANAAAVAEYVVAALLELRMRHGIAFEGRSLGLVGCGHVGRRVARYAAALGMRVVVNDPPLARATCEPMYRPLVEVLDCDVVTLHVPLERGGMDPTYHLVDERFLDRMKPGAVLINTARGAVVDSQALKTAIKSGRPAATVLDVWENEPGIDAELYELATTGTAHIGGLTLDAKVRAVEMLRGALVRYVGARAEDASIAKGDSRLRGNDNWGRIGEIPAGRVTVGPGVAPLVAIAETVKTTFDIAVECGRLGRALRQANPAAAFEALRSADATRREFSAFDVAIDAAHPAAATLAALGFGVTTAIAATAPAAAGLEP